MFGSARKRSVFGRANGFTLIELLVVIAIIALLAAILFPVFARAREKARQTQCASNEKQLALGMMQYVQDNDETYPGFANWGFGGDWGTPILPYTNSTQLLHCPSTNGTGPDYEMNGFLGCGNGKGVVQSGSTQCTGCAPSWCNPPGLTLAQVPLPAVTWLYWEGADEYYAGTAVFQTYNSPGNHTDPNLCPTTTGGPFTVCWYGDNNFTYQLHHNGMNITYTDGHVKFMPQAQLRTLGNSTVFAGAINGVITSWHSNKVSDQEPNE